MPFGKNPDELVNEAAARAKAATDERRRQDALTPEQLAQELTKNDADQLAHTSDARHEALANMYAGMGPPRQRAARAAELEARGLKRKPTP